MIDNCILHIGMNKTGTTSIQNYLQNNDLGNDFYYVNLGSSNHSLYITSLFSNIPEKNHNYVKRGLNKEEILSINLNIRNTLIENFNKKAAKNYIISGEAILNLNIEELISLKNFLDKYFSKITVVAYIREPWSFMESLYQQGLKGGLINDFNIAAMYPRYRKKFVKFYNVFGDSNVNLWQFNPSKFHNNNIINDFCNKIGMNYISTETVKLNQSLSLEAVSLLFVNRQFFSYGRGPNSTKENNHFINKLKNIGSTKFEFHNSIIKPILGNKKEDIEWIENKIQETLIIKKSSSEGAVKSEEDLTLIAKSAIKELLKVYENELGNKPIDIDNIEEIAQKVENLKINKKELCIVHIGMPKTGSSALQESLFANIIDNQTSYANLPTSNHSAIIFSMFASNPATHHLHQGMKNNKKKIEKFNKKNKKLLVEGFTKHQSEIEIISGEDIFHIDENGLRRMKNFLEEYFKKILIIGYVRPPKSFMESAFQQLVKNHNLDNFNFSLIYPHYKNKLEKFDIIFGTENVYLWKFDPKNFPNGDITLDFCRHLNIKTDEKLSVKANETISQEAISLLYANNKYGKHMDFGIHNMQINNLLVKYISKIGTNKFKFSGALINNVLDGYQTDLNWIENRMGISLEESQAGLKNDIHSEEELLKFSDKTINELKKLIGINYLPKESLSDSPEDVSKLVTVLKIKLANEFGFEKNKIFSEGANIEYNILKKFDIDWKNYHTINKINDVSIHPIMHYVNNWRRKNLIIENFFNTCYYLDTYSDIKKADINPLIHYCKHGIEEGRQGIEINDNR